MAVDAVVVNNCVNNFFYPLLTTVLRFLKRIYFCFTTFNLFNQASHFFFTFYVTPLALGKVRVWCGVVMAVAGLPLAVGRVFVDAELPVRGELLPELPDVVLVLGVSVTVFSNVLSPWLLVIRDLPGCHPTGKGIPGHHLVVVRRWLTGLLPWLLWKIRSVPGSSLCFPAPGRGRPRLEPASDAGLVSAGGYGEAVC